MCNVVWCLRSVNSILGSSGSEICIYRSYFKIFIRASINNLHCIGYLYGSWICSEFEYQMSIQSLFDFLYMFYVIMLRRQRVTQYLRLYFSGVETLRPSICVIVLSELRLANKICDKFYQSCSISCIHPN